MTIPSLPALGLIAAIVGQMAHMMEIFDARSQSNRSGWWPLVSALELITRGGSHESACAAHLSPSRTRCRLIGNTASLVTNDLGQPGNHLCSLCPLPVGAYEFGQCPSLIIFIFFKVWRPWG